MSVSLQGVEDPLLELKTPTLFIIGSHSTLTSQEDVEVNDCIRLQAVPFWIVEWQKTGANKRRGLRSSRLFLLAPVSLLCERTLSTNQKGTACNQ